MSTSLKPARTISENGLIFIKSFEGLRLKAYYDAAGIVTIGYGTTHYEDGMPIKITDAITKPRAEKLLKFEANAKAYILAQTLDKYNIHLNQNQFDALCSFSYNVGLYALLGSTLFKLIKNNPSDANIKKAFMMWVKITRNGKKIVLAGLVERRIKESDLYFS